MNQHFLLKAKIMSSSQIFRGLGVSTQDRIVQAWILNATTRGQKPLKEFTIDTLTGEFVTRD